MTALGRFDWVFLFVLCAFGVATIVFLFYFNRIITSILSWVINTYTWNFYRISLDIQAVQISPLGGRLFFKGIRYHGENESILVNDGYITWRYWFRRVRTAEAVQKNPSLRQASVISGGSAPEPALAEDVPPAETSSKGDEPCRILIEARGAEWFVYNRKPAYDSILATLLKPTSDPNELANGLNYYNEDAEENYKGKEKEHHEQSSSNSSAQKEMQDVNLSKANGDDVAAYRSSSPDSDSDLGASIDQSSNKLPAFLRILPVGFKVTRAAMVMGNEHTRSILVAKVDNLNGLIDARLSGPKDLYRQCFDFELKNSVVQFKPNEDYIEPQLNMGSRIKQETQKKPNLRYTTSWARSVWRARKDRFYHSLNFGPFKNRSEASLADNIQPSRNEPPNTSARILNASQNRWLGLSRYLKDDSGGQLDQERWKAIEYARFETIVDSPRVAMKFFWDVPGKVPSARRLPHPSQRGNINGDIPPSYGLEINVHGGIINYGPWADRQRVDIQNIFFPASHTTIKPAPFLRQGQTRISTAFKIAITLQEEVTLRIHTKEESKDWRWKDLLEQSDVPSANQKTKSKKTKSATPDLQIRPAGWMDLIVGADSSVVYSMDMVAGSSGYNNALQMEIKPSQMTSSVNHGLMWRCNGGTLNCSLPSPLTWNSFRQWQFDILIEDFELFIIRDHAFLLQDLVNDWTTGPPGEFFAFVPIMYSLRLKMPNFKVYLNVNDSNIIDNPASLDENAFLVIDGNDLCADIGIPIKEFRPLRNKVTFDVDVGHGGIRLIMPLWSTPRSFLKDDLLGSFSGIVIHGSYNYCTSTSPAHTDTVLLDVQGNTPCFSIYGFLIRYFMNFKDNYFGEDLHFQTQEEYQRRINPLDSQKMKPKEGPGNVKISNDLDVILTIVANNSSILMPSNLYSLAENVKVDVATISADLRFTNYYMDLQVDSSPLAFTRGFIKSGRGLAASTDSSTQAFVDGLTVSGHRLFGLPPTEPTYVCNWDFSVGSITGECSLEFVANVVGAARSFAFTFIDSENALPKRDIITLHDITFLRATLDPIKLWVHVDSTAILVDISAFSVDFNDWAGKRFSERLYLSVPKIVLACIDGRSASRNHSNVDTRASTYAYLSTSVDIRLVESKVDFENDKRLQQNHVALQDARTHRTPWLIHENGPVSSIRFDSSRIRPPISPFPPMPHPINNRMSGESPQLSERTSRSTLSPHLYKKRSFFSSDIRRVPRQDSARREKLQASNQDNADYSLGTGDTIDDLGNRASRYEGRSSRKGSTNMAFSSAYEKPYFPLQSISPNIDNVPFCSVHQPPDDEYDVEAVEKDLVSLDKNIGHTTILVALNKGLRGLFTPDALLHINSLVSSLQPSTPENILDQLQMNLMSQAVSRSKPVLLPNSLSLKLTLPVGAVRLQNHTSDHEGEDNRRVYDLNLNDLNVTGRNLPADGVPESHQPGKNTLHLKLQKLSCRAIEHLSSSHEEQASIEVCLDNLISWLVQENGLTGDLQFNELRFINASRKVEQLASLVNSTLALGDSLTRSFLQTAVVQDHRKRSLIYHLATSKIASPDPPFLTSTSYALRATPLHPRNDDSWKLLSRLRHISYQENYENQKRILDNCSPTEMMCPADARLQTLQNLNQWRSWDLHDANSSSLIVSVFGPSENVPTPVVPTLLLPLSFCARARRVEVVIDPGPRQNHLQINTIVAAVSSKISNPHVSDPSSPSSHDSALEVSFANLGLRLNWGICEILESVLEQYLAGPPLSVEPLPEHRIRDPGPLMPWKINVIVAIDQVKTAFETINFKAFSECDEFVGSFTLSHNNDDQGLISGLVNSKELCSGISGLHRPIVDCRLINPSITGGLEKSRSREEIRQRYNIGGICHKLEVDLKEDALGLIGVADLFIRDEMSYVRHIEQDIIGRLRRLPQSVQQTNETPIKTLNVLLLLQEYKISVKLLSSLTYRIRGRIARSTLCTRDSATLRHTFDFDIGDTQHGFTNQSALVATKVFEMVFPPVNGQIISSKMTHGVVVNVTVAVQKIYIQAAEIHALFTTLSRREVSAFHRTVQKDLNLVKSNWKTVAATSHEKAVEPQDNRSEIEKQGQLRYNVSAVIAGLNIRASSSSSSKLSAELVFDIGPCHLEISNLSPDNNVLSFPEGSAATERIEVMLVTSDGLKTQSTGDLSFTASFVGTSRHNLEGQLSRSFEIFLDYFHVNLYPSTASTIVDILGYLQQRFKSFNLSEEINTFRARRVRSKSAPTPHIGTLDDSAELDAPTTLFSSMFSLEMNGLRVTWHVGDIVSTSSQSELEDLVFSMSRIKLATRKANSARLLLKQLQLQMVPRSHDRDFRSLNSALLPEVTFNATYLSTGKDRRLGLQAIGKSLDLRLTSQFILPAVELQRSIAVATEELRVVIADWNAAFVKEEQQNKTLLGNKTLSSVLVDVDFDGAKVHIQGKKASATTTVSRITTASRIVNEGSKSRSSDSSGNNTTLVAPGIAFKIEYKNIPEDHSLSAEVKVDASSNELHPTVVPLILEVSESVKMIVGDTNLKSSTSKDNLSLSPIKFSQQEASSTDPTAILGNCRLNIGVRICRQNFGLTCHPVAQVAAIAQFEDIYIAVNTVQSARQDRFFAVTAAIRSLEASVKHVYSREKTGSFALDSINLSLINSRHVSETEGISAILKLSPMRININAKQLHDFFLFREIWLPVNLRETASAAPPAMNQTDAATFGVQKYQQMSASGAFLWNASVAIESLDIRVDLGQSLGKTSFSITDFWISSRKASESRQNLCLGFKRVAIESAGRLSGFVELCAFRVQTSIQFPQRSSHQTPLVEASLGFDDLRAKIAYEYQMFLVLDFSSLEFLMYNVRSDQHNNADRLVCTVDGDKLHLYFTTQTAALALGLYQAIQRLIEDKKAAYKQSLKDATSYLKKVTSGNASPVLSPTLQLINEDVQESEEDRAPIKLQTNVMMSLKAVKIGAYPNTFFDGQIFKLEALDALARFSVALRNGHIENSLSMQLGQVRVALSAIARKEERKSTDDLSVEDVVTYSAGSRGGTVLKVPKVLASMETSQRLDSTHIDYIFKSAFEGKVEVGWNYSRISYIRGMWEKQGRALAQRLGKPLPQSAVQISGGPRPKPDREMPRSDAKEAEEEKITAVVNVPLSKYTYKATETPIIVTPQLRDMGEATPPLEWIGLHRERLPNVTHQMIIVPLQGVAKEVEDAYSRILGSS